MPKASCFYPETGEKTENAVTLTIEEYETIRLIDRVGLTQEECADFMQVARTTVQQIYWDARKKLAQMLVDGVPLRIEGGTYQLCNGSEKSCGSGCCHRKKNREEQEENV